MKKKKTIKYKHNSSNNDNYNIFGFQFFHNSLYQNLFSEKFYKKLFKICLLINSST